MRRKAISTLLTAAMVVSVFGGLPITASATPEHWTDGVAVNASDVYGGGKGALEQPVRLTDSPADAKNFLTVTDAAGSILLKTGTPSCFFVDDNFDSDTLGNVPTGWKKYNEGELHDVSDVVCVSSEHSFRLKGVYMGAGSYYKDLTYTPAGTIPDNLTVEADVYPASESVAGGLSLRDSYSNLMAQVTFKNSGLYMGNGKGAALPGSYPANCWYHLRLVHDFPSHTFDVYVDNTQVGSGLTMSSNGQPNRIMVFCGNDSGSNLVYFDNIQVYTFSPATRTAVTFNMNSGAGSAESSYYIAGGSSDFYDAATGGSEQTLTEPTKPGYTFGGWYKEEGCIHQIITADLALCAGTDYTDASANWTKTEDVTLYAKWLEMTPTGLDLDYENEQITDLAANADYSISGTSVTADADGKTKIQSGWFGTSLSVVKKGAAADNSFDSDAATLVVPARPAAPTGLAAVDETYPDAGNGKVTGVADTMAYKLFTASDWTAVSSGAVEITGLDDGTYYVRYQAVTSGSQAFTSEYASVTVGTAGATQETQPAAVPDYPHEKLTGLTAGSKYNIGGTEYTADVSGEIAIPDDWFGTSIGIVKTGNGTTTTNSAAQSFPLAARPITPAKEAFTVTQPSANASAGTIAGITAAMEYSADGGTSWTTGTGSAVSGLAAGNIIIRIKATDTAPKSGSLTVTITAYQAPSGGGTPSGGGGAQDNTKSVKIISQDGATAATGTVTSVDNGLSVRISSGAIDQLAGSGQRVTLEPGLVTVGFDAAAIVYIDSTAGSNDVLLKIVRVDAGSLSEANRQLVGDHPVYDFSLTAGSTAISDFGDGSVSVGIPYTPDADEDVNAIVVYYISDSGKLETVRGMYHADTGMVKFTTKHFSKYAVGYNKVSFSDVDANDWYEDAVTFLAARGITTGTGDGTFGPNKTLTRGQFMVMLMRSYGIEADTNPTDNFSDAGNSYYTNYLSAAKRLGISNGTGDNRFAPDSQITRQGMFTLLYRALDVLGEIPEATGIKTTGDFKDAGQIADYAETAMNALVGAGIILGSDGKLNPTGTTTRTEMAQVLYRLMRGL